MEKKIAGLDVHSKKTFWAIQDMEGAVLAETECPTTPEGLLAVIRELRLEPGTRVGLEAGGQAPWICHVLTQAQLTPEVVSPQEVRAKVFRRGQKTDRRDALEICDGLRREQFVARVWLPPVEIRRLRQILSRRRHFLSIRTAQINAVKGLLKSECAGMAPAFLNSEVAWRRLLDRHAQAPWAAFLGMHHEMWMLARRQVAQLERELHEALAPFREVAVLLQSAPGVGPITAATFIATVGDPERFADSSRLGSYVGLAPMVYDSGDRQRHGPISKQGSTALRTALCEAAQHARKPNNPFHPYFARIKARSGYKKAIVAVAHRLLRVLYQMWKHHAPFDVTKLNVRYEPKTMTWTSYYQINKRPAA
jgi:transposase